MPANTAAAQADTSAATAPELPEGFVRATITKAGDGQVSTGRRVNNQDEVASRGDVLIVPAETGAALEARHFAEVD